MDAIFQVVNKISGHLLFWLLYVSFTVAIYYVQEPNLGLHIVYELASLPAKLISVYVTLYFILPNFLLKKKYVQAAIQFGLILLICVFLLRMCVLNTVYPLYFPEIENVLVPDDLAKLVSPFLDLIIVSSLAVVIKLLKDREQQERNRLSQEKSNIQNELQLLKSQLHPHFLFNTLNGLYAQILNNPNSAAEMVIKLSDLLRYIIYEARSPLVNVEDDLECIKNYIALEQVRYGTKLKLSWSITGATTHKKIPPLLLLPFIENSFKHGISKDYKKCWIKCKINLSNTMLEMDLKNSMVPCHQEENGMHGIGIQNVEQRLKYNFQEQFHLTKKIAEDCYHIMLKIPIVKP